MRARLCLFLALLMTFSLLLYHESQAQNKQAPKKEVIPHGQTQPPGPALTPQEAMQKMTVPPGFHVELVAAEPNLVNPVAMTFDEMGRIWVTESIEYPRRGAGPGKDRVKLLESTRGDGNYDKIRTVLEGLNIPSGIAVGHGGVWVANSPDILFYPFENVAEGQLGKSEVVVTGFGREDTHELPNSLTWGPDGWLYGLNGVFNHSHVKHKGKDYKFTCALFRIHPRTKDFEIFCEGTSNPWGIAFDGEGSAFVSACVIDHLWHLVQTGYYHRQGGPYPPYTWKIGSIVKHRHQKAAYCGLTWFDSDAYPAEYREKLYMGNIHGNCINSDELTRDGATYFARPRPDLLSANDSWFMPVAQKVGPDGCLYILDWYDRYHCYQDANRDPAGIDRKTGRLYRVVYKDYKPAGKFDLGKETEEKLVERLHSPNIYYRELAQRLLREKNTRQSLMSVITDDQAPRKVRLHALQAHLSMDQPGRDAFQGYLLQHKDPAYRAWTVRYIGNHRIKELSHLVTPLARDPSPDVQLQVAITVPKLEGIDPLPVLLEVLAHCGDDKLIPHIVWQNLHPLLEKEGERFLILAGKIDLARAPGVAKVLPRALDRILGNPSGDPTAVVKFIDKLTEEGKWEPAKLCLTALAVKIQNGEIASKQVSTLREQFKPNLKKLAQDAKGPLGMDAILLLALMKDADGISAARLIYSDDVHPEATRLRAMNALIAAGDSANVLDVAEGILRDKRGPAGYRGQLMAGLGTLDDPGVARHVLRFYAIMEPELQPKAIELLTQRPTWAKLLFEEIAAKKMNKDVINVNQARRLLGTKDKDLTKLIEKHWGIPRESRSPDRERVVAEMRELYKKTPGDPKAGIPVFKKLCAQCHKLYGEGVDVGPDITSNGRSDFDQLLSNIFDPSLVIGAGYQAITVNTKQGQVISGLLVEDNPQRVVLKVQGGELKTIARQDVDEKLTSKLSLMPEDLEKQLRPQEIIDLLAYLSLDRPPDDPKARKIPGTPR